MAEIINLNLPRNNNPLISELERQLRDVLAKQKEWKARRKQVEGDVWYAEQGLPSSIVGDGEQRPGTRAEVRAINSRDLYDAVAKCLWYGCLRANIRYCILMAKKGETSKLTEAMQNLNKVMEMARLNNIEVAA
jgi:hypothetical protein